MRAHSFLAVAGLVVATVAPAAPFSVVVEAPPELAGRAAEVRAIVADGLGDLPGLLGLAPGQRPIRVVLAPERSELASAAPSWVAGYALGPLRTIVLFPARVPSYPDRNLEALLRHEVTHLLTYEAAAGEPMPRWFVEGLATVAAREWGIEDRARTALAVIGRGPRSLADLDDAFSRGGSEAARAYALSAALVRHLQRRVGTDFTARTLVGVATGSTLREAFRKATGHSLDAEARAFFGREAFWRTWVPFLTSSTGLWMAITLLALWAIRRRRMRDGEIRARFAEEEAAQERAWAAKLRRLREESDDSMRHN